LNDPEIPDRALTRILSDSLRALGVLSFGFLDGPRLARASRGIPARIAASYGLAQARGAAVTALHYDTTGSPAGAMDAEYFRDREGRRLASLGWFARDHWYRELAEILDSVSRAPGLGPAGPRAAFRIAVNSRLPEKTLAVAAGLGPVGKNTLILERRAGPGCVLGVLVLPFEPDPAEGTCPPATDLPDTDSPGSDCGTCDECVRACPTGAVLPGGGIVRALCIQHWASVEEPVPKEVAGRWRGNLYGCDLCLAACPRFKPGLERRAAAGRLGRGLEPAVLLEAGDDELRARFRGTALGLSWIRPSLLKRNALLAAASWASIRFD